MKVIIGAAVISCIIVWPWEIGAPEAARAVVAVLWYAILIAGLVFYLNWKEKQKPQT